MSANTNDKNNKQRSALLNMVFTAMFTAIIAVCSMISIPVGEVPITLQTFAVCIAAALLGRKRGTLSVLIYILLGAVGVPVFSGMTGGIGVLAGPTGGYIIGFFFSALAMWGIERLFGNGTVCLLFSMLAGLFICYAFGTLWFMVVYTRQNGPVSLAAVLGWCVIPFIIPDLVKIAVALLIGPRIRRLVEIRS